MGHSFEADEDFEEDPEAPDTSDMDSDDNDYYMEAVPCPHCNKKMPEESPRCPHCKSYVGSSTSRRHRSLWIIAALLLIIGLILGGAGYVYYWR